MFKIISNIVIVLGLFISYANAKQILLWEQMEPNALKIFKQIVQEFNANNPDSKVILKHYSTEELRTNFQTASLAGSGPDIVYGPDDNIGIFTTSKLIAPINQFVSESFLSTFNKSALLSNTNQGVLYGLPDMQGNNIALVYNKKMISSPPKTWDEFLTASTQFQNASKSVKDSTYGLLFNIKEPYWFVGFYNGFGGEVFDSKGNISLNNQAMVDALTFVSDLVNKYNLGLKGMDYNISDQLFLQGKAAFILQGSWAWGNYQEQKLDIGITYLPLPNGKNAKFYSSTKAFFISSGKLTADKKDDIAKFFAYIFNSEVYKNYVLSQGIIPTIESLKSHDEIKKNFLIQNGINSLNYTKPMPNVIQIRAVWDAIRPNLEQVIDQKITPTQAAKLIDEQAQKLVKMFNN